MNIIYTKLRNLLLRITTTLPTIFSSGVKYVIGHFNNKPVVVKFTLASFTNFRIDVYIVNSSKLYPQLLRIRSITISIDYLYSFITALTLKDLLRMPVITDNLGIKSISIKNDDTIVINKISFKIEDILYALSCIYLDRNIAAFINYK